METIQEELGPIDVVVIAYPAGAPMTGDAVPLFLDLVDRGIIRVFDALFVRKAQDGTFSGFDLADLDQDSVGDLTAFAGASTATAVSNRVSRRQYNRWSQQDQQPYYQEPAQPPAQPAPPAPAPPDRITQLKQLGELKAQGVLTAEEFAAQKARILGQ